MQFTVFVTSHWLHGLRRLAELSQQQSLDQKTQITVFCFSIERNTRVHSMYTSCQFCAKKLFVPKNYTESH